jgi:NAD(P)H-dependent FMN reductase
MITVISSTNRPDSNTSKVGKMYQFVLTSMGKEAKILDLQDVESQWIQESKYRTNSPEFEAIVSNYIRPVSQLIFVVPEYNGSFPGYLKYFMDACDQHDFRGKKVALMGLASGRSGNVRGLDHLTGILHYLGAEVYSGKVYLSLVNHSLTETGELVNDVLQSEIESQLKGFVTF